MEVGMYFMYIMMSFLFFVTLKVDYLFIFFFYINIFLFVVYVNMIFTSKNYTINNIRGYNSRENLNNLQNTYIQII
jgi:hypothetical protein